MTRAGAGQVNGINVRAWYFLARNQLYGFMREPAAAVFNMAVPFFIIIIQAIAYGTDTYDDGSGHTFTVAQALPVSAGAIYTMIIGIFGMGVGLASMIESRTLASFRCRPGGMLSIVSAYGVVLTVVTVLGFVCSIVVLAIGWDVRIPRQAVFLPLLLLLSLSLFLGLGACVAAISSSPRSAQGICSAIFFPMLFLSGAMFPIDDFPAALRVLASALPGKHIYELLSYSWFEMDKVPVVSLCYVLFLAVLLTPLSAWLFRRREDL